MRNALNSYKTYNNAYAYIVMLEDTFEQEEQIFEVHDREDEGFVDTEQMTWHHPKDK